MLDLSKVRWLVLDEADRLMDMGFEVQVSAIVAAIVQQREAAAAGAAAAGAVPPPPRQTVMMSATITEAIARLAAATLTRPVFVHADADGGAASGAGGLPLDVAALCDAAMDVKSGGDGGGGGGGGGGDGSGTTTLAAAAASAATGAPRVLVADAEMSSDVHIPSSLVQQYVVVPPKWKLVHIAGFVRLALLAGGGTDGAAKIVVFLCSCDSVDFHFAALATAWSALCAGAPGAPAAVPSWHGGAASRGRGDDEGGGGGGGGDGARGLAALPPHASCSHAYGKYRLFKLHGNMPQSARAEALRGFCAPGPAVLLATDVAARGLDLPAVSLILQPDPPSEVLEYVHRVGRAARRGRSGRAVLFVAPTEVEFAKVRERPRWARCCVPPSRSCVKVWRRRPGPRT